MVCLLAELAYGLLSPLTEFFSRSVAVRGKVQPLLPSSSCRGWECCPGPPCPVPPQFRGPGTGMSHCGLRDAQGGKFSTEYLKNNCVILVLLQAFFSPSLLINEIFFFSHCLATRKVDSSTGQAPLLSGAFRSILAVITDNTHK